MSFVQMCQWDVLAHAKDVTIKITPLRLCVESMNKNGLFGNSREINLHDKSVVYQSEIVNGNKRAGVIIFAMGMIMRTCSISCGVLKRSNGTNNLKSVSICEICGNQIVSTSKSMVKL